MTAQFLFDTDICSYVMKRAHPRLLRKIQSVPLIRQSTSVVSAGELFYGAALASDPVRARAAVAAFLTHVTVIDWNLDSAQHYGDIRADLHRRGLQIGANDLLIAAQARSTDSILVTNNVREFRRVQGLRLENWVN